MKIVSIFLVFFISAGMASVVPRVTRIDAFKPVTFKVSLDDSPLERWNQIVPYYI